MDSFGHLALAQLPRVLGFLDREASSKTFGCFDRSYWHYRITDFPSAWFQLGIGLLTMAFGFNHPDNRYSGHPKIKAWAHGAINFWARTLHRDGSADEAYPFERSFCATAFTAAAAVEACSLLDIPLPGRALKSAEWLEARDNLEASNQQAAAALSLAWFAHLTGEAAFGRAADEKMERLLAIQTTERYFPEYGGPDTGYLSLTLSLLAQYYALTGEDQVAEAGRRTGASLDDQIGDDGRFRYQQGSRQAAYLYPYGLAVFAPELLERLGKGLRDDRVIQPGWLDDRYMGPLATDYLRTAMAMVK